MIVALDFRLSFKVPDLSWIYNLFSAQGNFTLLNKSCFALGGGDVCRVAAFMLFFSFSNSFFSRTREPVFKLQRALALARFENA